MRSINPNISGSAAANKKISNRTNKEEFKWVHINSHHFESDAGYRPSVSASDYVSLNHWRGLRLCEPLITQPKSFLTKIQSSFIIDLRLISHIIIFIIFPLPWLRRPRNVYIRNVVITSWWSWRWTWGWTIWWWIEASHCGIYFLNIPQWAEHLVGQTKSRPREQSRNILRTRPLPKKNHCYCSTVSDWPTTSLSAGCKSTGLWVVFLPPRRRSSSDLVTQCDPSEDCESQHPIE